MTAVTLTGIKGSITIPDIGPTGQMALLNRWTVNASREIFDATGFGTGSNVRAKLSGMYEWSWSGEGWLDAAAAFALTQLTDELSPVAALVFTVKSDAALNTLKQFSGDGWVETCEIVTEKRGVCQVRLSGQGKIGRAHV